MKNSKLVEEAKLNPVRIYPRPHDVLRDRRLNDFDRLEILSAWQGEASGDPDKLEDIRRAREEIESRLPAQRAAE